MGADAESVNSSVATPIAQSVMGVSDMLYMQTTSANDGSMTMQVTFDIGSDPDIDAILTQNNLSSASALLPEVVIKEGVITEKTNNNFLIVYAIYSDDRYDDLFLTNYAYLNLQNELLKINGVSKVQIMGSAEYAMRVWVNPEKMSYYGVTLAELSDVVATQSGIYPAGKFGAEPSPEATTYTYTLQLPAQIATAEQFGDIIVRANTNGDILYLKDIAKIELGSQSYGITSQFGKSPASIVVIYQSPGSNAVDVGAKVKSAMANLSNRFPDGIEYATIIDSTVSINAGISDIFRTLIIALLLVIAIIYLFLQDIRATLIPLIAIPVSLVGAFILFPLLGFSINIISLLGLVLAIGLVVDDAIVVVEAAQVNISKGLSAKEAAKEAISSVSSPIIATTLVLLAVFIPISLTGGITGLLYQQFAAIISFAVVLSAINALTLSPALCSILLGRSSEKKGWLFSRFNRWFERVMQGYSKRVGVVIKHSGRTAIFVAITIVAIVMIWRALPAGFLPEEDEGYVMVMVELPENSALELTTAAMDRINSVIAQLPEVKATPYTAGFNLLAGITESNSGIFFVQLVDYSKRNLTAAEIAHKLNGMLYVEVPEALAFAFIPPAIPGLGISSGITFEIQDLEGKGEEYLYGESVALMEHLKANPLTSQVTTQYSQGVPQRLLDIDIEHAVSLGINPTELYELVSAMFGGSYISNFNRFGRLYQVYIEADPDFRVNKQSLENYTLQSSKGGRVPLSSVVNVIDTTGVNYVSQFNLYRSIGVTVTPSPKATTSEVMALIDGYTQDSLPNDIGIAWSGVSYQEREAAKSGNFIYVIVVLFVFLTLAALYNSWGLPMAILFSVPIAVLGALGTTAIVHLVNAKYINDIYLQISLIMLIGLAAKNAILVVEYADRNIFKLGMSARESAINAAKERVRPILMTAFAFVLGVTPLIFASGVYATARNIMGVALVGGMVVATLVGIYLYPTLYYMVAKLAKFEKIREQKKGEK